MSTPIAKTADKIHDIVKNFDYAIRLSNVKSVLIASDSHGEGKSTTIETLIPLWSKLYRKKVLVLNLTSENLLGGSVGNPNLTVAHICELEFLNDTSELEKTKRLNSYIKEAKKSFDHIIVNMTTNKRADKTQLPKFDIEGAIIVRSKKSQKRDRNYITEDIQDRNIPIVGLIYNEGL